MSPGRFFVTVLLILFPWNGWTEEQSYPLNAQLRILKNNESVNIPHRLKLDFKEIDGRKMLVVIATLKLGLGVEKAELDEESLDDPEQKTLVDPKKNSMMVFLKKTKAKLKVVQNGKEEEFSLQLKYGTHPFIVDSSCENLGDIELDTSKASSTEGISGVTCEQTGGDFYLDLSLSGDSQWAKNTIKEIEGKESHSRRFRLGFTPENSDFTFRWRSQGKTQKLSIYKNFKELPRMLNFEVGLALGQINFNSPGNSSSNPVLLTNGMVRATPFSIPFYTQISWADVISSLNNSPTKEFFYGDSSLDLGYMFEMESSSLGIEGGMKVSRIGSVEALSFNTLQGPNVKLEYSLKWGRARKTQFEAEYSALEQSGINGNFMNAKLKHYFKAWNSQLWTGGSFTNIALNSTQGDTKANLIWLGFGFFY